MKHLQIYDPPMCCSTGVCGPDVDPELVHFAALTSRLQQDGVKVERSNLGQQPLEFVKNPIVKAILDGKGTEGLPAIFCDGELLLEGRYPTREERTEWRRRLPKKPREAAAR
jgi:hypothetical protein